MPSPISSVLHDVFGVNVKHFEWRVMLPTEAHVTFNRIVLPLMVFCFFAKLLSRFRRSSRLIARIVESKRLESLLVLFMRLYKLTYISIYTFELTHLQILGRMPSMATHHITSSIAFLYMAWGFDKIYPALTDVNFLPYVVHTVYWAYWLEDSIITMYNITLFIAFVKLANRPKELLMMKVLLMPVIASNYWAYCDDMMGTYCIGTLIGHDEQNKFSSFYYVPNAAGICSALSFLFVVALPYMSINLARYMAATREMAKSKVN